MRIPPAALAAAATGALVLAPGHLLEAIPATATLTLVEQEGVNEVDLSVGLAPLLPDGTDSTTLSGTVEVLLEIDPDTGEVSELSAQGGSVTGTGVSMEGSRFLVGSYDFDSTDLGAALSTPLCPGVVDSATGEFEASQHAFTLISGDLSGSVRVLLLGLDESVTFDFGTQPITGRGAGTGTVDLVETASTADSKTYDIVVEFPLNLEQTVEQGPIPIPVTAAGNLRAVGTTTVSLIPRDPYTAWTEVHGIAGAEFDHDENGDGVPNGLQWALGLCADTPPWQFLLQPAGKQETTVIFTLNLHPARTDGELCVLFSKDPRTDEFLPLASEAVSSGNPIPVGTKGAVTISLPQGQQGFLRLGTEAP